MGLRCINYDEKALVTKNGMNYYNIKSYTKKPDEKNIAEFLDIVEAVKKKGGKLHIHCKAGADRTGMYAYIYEVLNNIKTSVAAKFEWFKHGYHFNLYPKLMDWTDNFIKNYKKL
jgi:protein-tyrosine phosphatase